MLSEVSLKEKDKYHMLLDIYGLYRKMGLTNPPSGQQWRCRHRKETCGHRGEREGGMSWESIIETQILSYANLDSQWEFSV